jgi:hypothetical protein
MPAGAKHCTLGTVCWLRALPRRRWVGNQRVAQCSAQPECLPTCGQRTCNSTLFEFNLTRMTCNVPCVAASQLAPWMHHEHRPPLQAVPFSVQGAQGEPLHTGAVASLCIGIQTTCAALLLLQAVHIRVQGAQGECVR